MKGQPLYTFINKLAAICMMLMLLWLTISAPFVFAAQQELAKQEIKTSPSADEESSNPYGNNTEEKAPSSTSFSEEFLHDTDKGDLFSLLIMRTHIIQNSDTYHAYHGELLVPPPNLA